MLPWACSFLIASPQGGMCTDVEALEGCIPLPTTLRRGRCLFTTIEHKIFLENFSKTIKSNRICKLLYSYNYEHGHEKIYTENSNLYTRSFERKPPKVTPFSFIVFLIYNLVYSDNYETGYGIIHSESSTLIISPFMGKSLKKTPVSFIVFLCISVEMTVHNWSSCYELLVSTNDVFGWRTGNHQNSPVKIKFAYLFLLLSFQAFLFHSPSSAFMERTLFTDNLLNKVEIHRERDPPGWMVVVPSVTSQKLRPSPPPI